MHLFYSASQTIKNGYLGRLICHIFGIFTVNFGLGQSKWHGFPNLLGPFQGPNRFVALLPQSDKTSQNHNEYRMLSSFARTLPFKLHQLLVWIQKTLMTQFVQSIESFCKVFTTVDQTTRKYIFQAFTSVYLAHYKGPERHFHNKIVEIDTSIPDNLVSAILIFPVTLAPLTSFHASIQRQEFFFC